MLFLLSSTQRNNPGGRHFSASPAALLLHPGKSAGRVKTLQAFFFVVCSFLFLQLVSAGGGVGGLPGRLGMEESSQGRPRGWAGAALTDTSM